MLQIVALVISHAHHLEDIQTWKSRGREEEEKKKKKKKTSAATAVHQVAIAQAETTILGRGKVIGVNL